jgi:hypothetical protein
VCNPLKKQDRNKDGCIQKNMVLRQSEKGTGFDELSKAGSFFEIFSTVNADLSSASCSQLFVRF